MTWVNTTDAGIIFLHTFMICFKKHSKGSDDITLFLNVNCQSSSLLFVLLCLIWILKSTYISFKKNTENENN